MEDCNNIIEGILYLKGDEGIDIKELSLILEISKRSCGSYGSFYRSLFKKRL